MIKKKKWLSICLVICLIGGIGGAAWYRQKKIEERRMSLVYIPKVEDSTNDFWKALILGTKMAAKEYNADIEIKAPNEENDIERQNELLKEAISEEPDAILFSPSSFTESNDLLKEAKEKGIRISFIDSYTEEKVQDLTVATDNLEVDNLAPYRLFSGLRHMEKIFLDSKSQYDSSATFIWTPDKINAHFVIGFVSFTLMRMLQAKLDFQFSMEQIGISLQRYNCVQIVYRVSRRV